jgi:hypothetical protein
MLIVVDPSPVRDGVILTVYDPVTPDPNVDDDDDHDGPPDESFAGATAPSAIFASVMPLAG